jgi:hypothetical protein
LAECSVLILYKAEKGAFSRRGQKLSAKNISNTYYRDEIKHSTIALAENVKSITTNQQSFNCIRIPI